MRRRLRQLGRPHAHVGVLGLMDGEVGRPDSVVDLALPVVPLLEEVASVLLMTWVDLWKIDHLLGELSLFETLVDQEIVLLVDSSMATLTGSLENLESSSESSRVIGVSPFL